MAVMCGATARHSLFLDALQAIAGQHGQLRPQHQAEEPGLGRDGRGAPGEAPVQQEQAAADQRHPRRPQRLPQARHHVGEDGHLGVQLEPAAELGERLGPPEQPRGGVPLVAAGVAERDRVGERRAVRARSAAATQASQVRPTSSAVRRGADRHRRVDAAVRRDRSRPDGQRPSPVRASPSRRKVVHSSIDTAPSER